MIVVNYKLLFRYFHERNEKNNKILGPDGVLTEIRSGYLPNLTRWRPVMNCKRWQVMTGAKQLTVGIYSAFNGRLACRLHLLWLSSTASNLLEISLHLDYKLNCTGLLDDWYSNYYVPKTSALFLILMQCIHSSHSHCFFRYIFNTFLIFTTRVNSS